MASKPTPPAGGPSQRPTSGKVALGVTRPPSVPNAPAVTGPSSRPKPARTPQPKTKLTPWPPTGSAKKRRKRRKKAIPRWALAVFLLVVGAGFAWVRFGPKAEGPTVLAMGGGLQDVDGELVLTAASLERLGALGQVLEAIPVQGGKITLNANLINTLATRAPGVTWLRATRAGSGGQARTLITLLPREFLPAAAEVLLTPSPDSALVRGLAPAHPIRFSTVEQGGFELVPVGAGPVFLDGTCKNAQPVPPGEWFLLYHEGAAVDQAIESNSEAACVDACNESTDACTDCRFEQANRRTAVRQAQSQEQNRRYEKIQALSQSLAIRADETRYRLSLVDPSCYGVIPRYDAELVGAFIVPLEPRHLVLETANGEHELR